ncbi:MAG: hypothetical protein KIT73_06810 [Burkholderiales bacterium]|nr:hypothetical protein [Burkholderiales bacterium]
MTPRSTCFARRILLASTSHAGAVRFLTGLHVSLEDGKGSSWVTVTRTGTFSDPRYGSFEISRDMLLQMVSNFDAHVLGQDVFIDVSHRPDQGAAGKVLKLSVEGDRLRAQVEWTPYGVDAIRGRGYQYLSAEYHENWQDNEHQKRHGCVLLGAGLTVRPVIKRLDPVQLSEVSVGDVPVLMHPELQLKLSEEIRIMWKALIDALATKLKGFKLADAVVASIVLAAEKALGPVTDESAAKALVATFESTGKTLAETIGDKEVTIKLDLPTLPVGVSADDVRRILAEDATRRAAEAKTLADTTASRVKLLTDTIGAAQGLDDATKKKLADAVVDLVGPHLTDDQVKALAAAQIAQGHELVAARTLAGLGFRSTQTGRPFVSVDDANAVKSLQETIDKRLGYAAMPDRDRYRATGGVLQEENKRFAEKVLAEFDAAHGARLHAEHKALAGGDSVVSDVAVPAIFERTVIREALYQLIGLQFADVGTVPFTAVAQIPYSYRDTTAAGPSAVRVFEGGAIQRAAVKQSMEEMRPIPQKLSFEVSDELRYLTSNGQLDWDAVAENTRNAARIIGEDTESLIFNEVLQASEQFGAVAVVTEAVGSGNGSFTIFPLNNFPVVRPKKIYDLQGNQVGSTLYPITVTVNAVAINEWAPGVGAGTYYVMDFNLGELRFVNASLTPVAITNAHAIVCSYTYATNVFKFDTDLGSLKVEEKWDDFLYRFGLRKNILESDRYHAPDFGLMSGTVRTQVEQARSFAANFAREGTALQTNGNLGVIKGLPQFRTTAPGLQMGDQRVVLGVRGTTRFRMAKAWAMGQLENQKNADGRFTGKKEAYGDQFVICGTPTPLKNAYTSVVLYGAGARVDRVS